jgi:murein DD-endopeptidase MepM/ murein hydrolase activator NlpD
MKKMNEVFAMQKGKKYYTIMFIPEGNAKTFSIHVNRNILYSLTIFTAIFFIGFLCLLFKSGEIATKLQLVYALTQENKSLKEENKKLNFIRTKIAKIEALGEYLQQIATAAGENVKKPSYAANLMKQSDETVFKKDGIDENVDKIRLSSSETYHEFKQKGEASEGFLAAIPNIQPTEGWITRRYIATANDTEQSHSGIDFAATSGTLIRSTARGVVDDVYKDAYFGLMVIIKHGYGFSTRYGHCLQVLVAKGDHVERGQTIALVGNTGRSSAPHLHYEILKDGKNVDPKEYIIRGQN